MSSKMPPEGFRRMSLINRCPEFLLTLGLAGWLEAIFTIEWSFPYCSSQSDGPASAVYGMPLPYIRWAGVSSMEYELMPSILILNILMLSVILFPLVSWTVRKIASPNRGWLRILLSLAGLVLLVGVGMLTAFLVRVGVYKIPVSTIASDYETYSEFRPIRFTTKHLRYQCTPSNFWFKDGWQPKPEKADNAAGR
ncbi:MAG TPA: hypothetical protein VF721_15365 [Pyrinomonadaceae bacterium]|jgi:hypothetical protein